LAQALDDVTSNFSLEHALSLCGLEAKPMTALDVKLPFAMTGPKTTAGKGVFQMAKVVADILRLVAELWPPPVTSTALREKTAGARFECVAADVLLRLHAAATKPAGHALGAPARHARGCFSTLDKIAAV